MSSQKVVKKMQTTGAGQNLIKHTVGKRKQG